MNTVVEAAAVSKRLGARTVLRSLDLAVGKGEFVVLVGPSGSGKTTLLRLLAGLERADGGRVVMYGTPVDQPDRGIFTPAENRAVGMVFQNYALWPHLRAIDNIAMVLKGRSARRRREQSVGWLQAVGLAALASRYPHELSGGQQQRIGIARALATRPRLLLLDEPLSSLDVETRETLRVELRRIVREHEVTALLVSHDPDDAWHLADRIAVLEEGSIVQYGPPQELFRRPATALVARFTGAHLVTTGRMNAHGFLAGSRHLGVTLPPGRGLVDGRLYVRPEGVSRGDDPSGLTAGLAHAAFEAGRYRCYWNVPGFDAPLVSYETAPPPPVATLRIDPRHAFVF